MLDLVDKARQFALKTHGRIDHRRKYSSEPYPVHLQAVADLVASVRYDPEMIAAAWLHDTIEDTPTTEAELQQRFGVAVVQLVGELTDVSQAVDGNRAIRKLIDRGHAQDIVSHDFAQVARIAQRIESTFHG